MSPLLPLILLPLVASLFIAVGANARRTALGAAFINLLLSIFLFARYDLHAGGWQFVSEWHVLPRLGINLILGADGLTLSMLLLSTLVTFSALWVAPKIEKQEGLYYIALLFISAGVIGAFSSLDVLFLYSFHELALIPTFLLIGIWGSGDRQAAAWKATIYLGTGSFVLLIGLLALYISMPSGVRTFDLRQMNELALSGGLNPAPWIYLVLLIGFGTLVSLFPFHSWAPPAYASAPAPAAMLHAGVLKKFGLYGLIRIVLPLFPPAVHDFFNPLLIILLIGNIGYIGYVTVAQKRLDWTVGYSSVMHMGYIFLGLAAFTPFNLMGLNGAVLLMFAHGLSVAAAFALCGEIRQRTGTLDYSELGGLAKALPVLGLLFGFVTMASVGLPGFANFAGEILVFFGAAATLLDPHFSSSFLMMVAIVIGVWGVVISAIYMLRAYRSIFWGPIAARWETLTDITPTARYSVILLLIPLMIAGFYPQFILKMVETAFPR